MTSAKATKLQIEGRTYEVQVEQLSSSSATVLVDGKAIQVAIEAPTASKSKRPTPQAAGALSPSPQAQPAASPASGNSLCAMMPGVVTVVMVKQGQEVATGDTLLILEAMKMENEIRSDRTGKIGEVHVSAGQQVQTGEAMICFS